MNATTTAPAVTPRRARTLADIEAHPWVDSTHVEDDGCFQTSDGRDLPGRWVYLKSGFISPDNGCGTIHESSVAKCCELLNDARPATFGEIEQQGYTLEEAQANWAAAGALQAERTGPNRGKLYLVRAPFTPYAWLSDDERAAADAFYPDNSKQPNRLRERYQFYTDGTVRATTDDNVNRDISRFFTA